MSETTPPLSRSNHREKSRRKEEEEKKILPIQIEQACLNARKFPNKSYKFVCVIFGFWGIFLKCNHSTDLLHWKDPPKILNGFWDLSYDTSLLYVNIQQRVNMFEIVIFIQYCNTQYNKQRSFCPWFPISWKVSLYLPNQRLHLGQGLLVNINCFRLLLLR